MSRKPIISIPKEFIREEDERVHKSFEFELITPMFGGDSKSWELDEKNPVRGQSVKGQLRFWWRTMQDETDAKKLLYKENAIWGGKFLDNEENEIRVKSPVSLAVINQNIERENITTVADDNCGISNYVLFPITGNGDIDDSDVSVIKNLRFTLIISYPSEYENDVLNTLKLWTLFGGVGARTRRGAGSIYCEELLENLTSVEDISNFISSFENDNVRLPYPRILGAKLFYKSGTSDSINDCKNFLNTYGKFRQDRNGRFGRSHWPEPDAIRRIAQTHNSLHSPEHPDGIWFPRSAFGLPILTTFGGKNARGEPHGNIELKPNDGERLPSPIILKVIKLSNGKILKIALVLNQKFPSELVLKVNRDEYPITGKQLPFYDGYEDEKIMRKGHELNGKTIYENLAESLNLEEVR